MPDKTTTPAKPPETAALPHWQVTIPGCKTLLVEAETDQLAVVAYMDAMGITASDHKPKVAMVAPPIISNEK